MMKRKKSISDLPTLIPFQQVSGNTYFFRCLIILVPPHTCIYIIKIKFSHSKILLDIFATSILFYKVQDTFIKRKFIQKMESWNKN